MKRQYTSYRPKYVNGRCRNEPIPMEPGELEAMEAALQSVRHMDGLTKKGTEGGVCPQKKGNI